MKYIIVSERIYLYTSENTSRLNFYVLNRNSLEEFSEKVNSKIADGYEPLGGITIKNDTSSYHSLVMQAMIKR